MMKQEHSATLLELVGSQLSSINGLICVVLHLVRVAPSSTESSRRLSTVKCNLKTFRGGSLHLSHGKVYEITALGFPRESLPPPQRVTASDVMHSGLLPVYGDC